MLGPQMSASGEKAEFDSGGGLKPAYRPPRNVRVVLGVEDHDLRGGQFLDMMRGVVEGPGAQLVPVLFGEPVAVAKCLADVSRVTFVGCLFLLLFRQDAPI